MIRPPDARRGRRLRTLVALAVAACGGGERPAPTAPVPPVPPVSTPGPVTPTPPAAPVLTELWIEGGYPAARLSADTLEQDLATGRVARGRTVAGEVVDATAEWSSGDTTVLGLLPTSSPAMIQVVSRSPGTTVLTARVGTLTASVPFVVTPRRVRGVTIQHAPTADVPFAAWVNQPDSVITRTQSRYVAWCTTDAGGGGRRLELPVTWATSDSARATVDSTGAVTARALGAVTLSAACHGTSGEVAEGSVHLVVRPPRAARIAITYAPDSLMLYHSDSLRGVLYDSAGAPTAIPVRFAVPAWGDPPWGVKDGVLTPIAVGLVEVVASGDGLTARHNVRVYAAPQGPPQTFPGVFTLATGTAAPIGARAVDVDGNDWPGAPPATYSSDAPGIASVSSAGLVRGLAEGTATIRVQTGATHTDVPVTVVAPGAFAVTTRRLGPDNAVLDAALRTAADAWGTAVLGDLPDLRLTLPADACDGSLPTEELTVDDVVVFARVGAIDGAGGVLAQAGPCVIREDGSAAVGLVLVDSADVASLGADGLLADVLRHEMGHVLGIGTLWSRPELGLVRQRDGQWVYVGSRGQRVAKWWGLAYGGDVLLGEADGPGSGHWAEGVFGNELMTPILSRGPNPLSLLTLEALGELGYRTAAAAAEPYGSFYPGSVSSAGRIGASRAPGWRAPAAGGRPITERLFTPRYRVLGNRLQRITPRMR